MQYSPLDQEYLQKLEISVLAHSAEQYRAALKVLHDGNHRTRPLVAYLEQCLAAVTREMNRRAEAGLEVDRTVS